MILNNSYFMTKVPRSAFMQDAFDVARKELLGAYLCSVIDGHLCVGKITEVEVYPGGVDKASHTYKNKYTPRTAPIFKAGGHAYVFFVYGMYHQFCVVTGQENEPCAILIRSLEPVIGIEIMQKRRKLTTLKQLTTGPAKLCQALGITKEMSGADLISGDIWIAPKMDKIAPKHILATPRIGVDYAGEYAYKKWRFVLRDNPFVSR